MAEEARHWDRTGDGGLTFTQISLGTAPLGNLYRAIPEAEADDLLAPAWEAGIRHFDTAPLYGFGLSETRLNRNSGILATGPCPRARYNYGEAPPEIVDRVERCDQVDWVRN